jgi:hypothetical protein
MGAHMAAILANLGASAWPAVVRQFSFRAAK